ncbi:MAG: methionyl-tRNA formyltransferase [Mucilaginibacter polytrichastri]|nr:methionyl-tRNA formyltransferase [Mucilaginibacter polytrichastri]
MRIIYMGTPDFAVPSLKALMDAGFEIAAVVTAPDKPAGRGMQMRQSAVKEFALQNELPVLQPEKLRDPDFITRLKNFNADLQVVVAFRMLPEMVWDMPRLGTVNVHASLLPQYRGAAPINWAIINGETETGITIFKLEHEIDTGNVLLAEKTPIKGDDTAGELHDKLMLSGAALLVKAIRGLEENTLVETSQHELHEGEILHTAPKLTKETGRIDWLKPATEVYNLIRGLSPYPSAYTTFKDKTLKIYSATLELTEPGVSPGAFISDGRSFLKFACKDGFVSVTDVQLEGKKRMQIDEFLRGQHL